MLDWNAISEELRKPLDKAHVKPARPNGPKGDYIEAWHAQAEANRIFGYGHWSQEVTETTCVHQTERTVGRNADPGWGVTYTAKVRVTIGDVVREDFGAGHGIDRDLGQAHESAIKEAVSDALKRALKSFGNPFGLALYDKERSNVADVAAEEAAARGAQLQSDIAVSLQSASTMQELAETWKASQAQWSQRVGGPIPPALAKVKDDMKAKLSPEGQAA